MAMKETEGSLRAYFFLVGVGSIALALKDISDMDKYGRVLTASQSAAVYFSIAAALAIGPAFLAAGGLLKKALLTGAGWIKTLLIAAAVVLLANSVLTAATLGDIPGVRTGTLIRGAIGIAIQVYLYRSVMRLSAEAQARAAAPAKVA
jgi:hypothetical protein